MRDKYVAVSIEIIVQMGFNHPSSFEIANNSSKFRRIPFSFVIIRVSVCSRKSKRNFII